MRHTKPHRRVARAGVWGVAVICAVLSANTLAQADDATSCAATTVLDVMYATQPGADPAQLSLDLHLPGGRGDVCTTPRPVVMYVHGGGWRQGDKRRVDRKAALFNAAGYALVSVNYRLSPNALHPNKPLKPGVPRYPDHNDDLARAVAWIHAHGTEHRLDPAKVVALGHSSGGTMVASLGVDPSHLKRAGLGLGALRGVIVSDTEVFDVAAAMGWANTVQRQLYRNAFGEDPERWRQASPATHVAPNTSIPPFLILYRGQPHRQEAARAFAEKLRKANVPAELYHAGDMSHAQVNRLLGAPDAPLTQTVLAFVQRCFNDDPRASALGASSPSLSQPTSPRSP